VVSNEKNKKAMAEQIPSKEGEKPVEVEPVVVPPEEPAVRKSAKDYIIERKERKIEKLESQKDEEGDDLGLDEELEEEEITPAGKKTIEKTVSKMVEPFINQARQQSDEAELAGVLAKYPNLKSLESEIRTWMKHPAYKDASIEVIALGLAAKKGKGSDAEAERQKADEEAAAGNISGSQRRPTTPETPIPDVTKMSDKEVDDLVFKVKTGGF